MFRQGRKAVLQVRLNKLGSEARVFERIDDLPFVLGAEGFDGDAKLHRRIAVGADELVVIESDDVAAVIGDDGGHAHELSGPVGQQRGHGEDAIAGDQAMLDDRRHRDDVHVAAGQDGDDA